MRQLSKMTILSISVLIALFHTSVFGMVVKKAPNLAGLETKFEHLGAQNINADKPTNLVKKLFSSRALKIGALGFLTTLQVVLPVSSLVAQTNNFHTTTEVLGSDKITLPKQPYEIIRNRPITPFVNPSEIPEGEVTWGDPTLEVFNLPQGMFNESGGALDPKKPTVLHVHGWNPEGIREPIPSGMEGEKGSAYWGDYNRLRYFWDYWSYSKSAPPTKPEIWAHTEGVYILKDEIKRLRAALPADYDEELVCVAHSLGSAKLLIANFLLLQEGGGLACDRIDLLDPWVDHNLQIPDGSPLLGFSTVQEMRDNRIAPAVASIAYQTHANYGIPVTVYNSIVSYFSGYSDVSEKLNADGSISEAVVRNTIWSRVHNVNLFEEKDFFREFLERIGQIIDKTTRQEALYRLALKHSQAVEYYYNSKNLEVTLTNSKTVGITAKTPTEMLKGARYTTKQPIDYDSEEAKFGERLLNNKSIRFFIKFDSGRVEW